MDGADDEEVAPKSCSHAAGQLSALWHGVRSLALLLTAQTMASLLLNAAPENNSVVLL